jgi:hypothetical protein
MSTNKLCPTCGFLNWDNQEACERCRDALTNAPAWEYPPLSQTEPSAWFWRIIDSAAGDEQKLRTLLGSLSERQIYEFQSEFLQAAADLQCEPFTDYMEESEDGIEDIAWWVVSRGSDYYRRVLDDPSILPYSSEDVSDDGTLVSVAREVYEEKFGYHLNLL